MGRALERAVDTLLETVRRATTPPAVEQAGREPERATTRRAAMERRSTKSMTDKTR